MKNLALTVGGSPVPVPDSIKHVMTKTDNYGAGILMFGIEALMVTAFILALVFLVWGGITWIMSGGEKTKLQAARNTLLYAIAGLVVSLLAFALVNLVTFFLLGENGVAPDFFGTP